MALHVPCLPADYTLAPELSCSWRKCHISWQLRGRGRRGGWSGEECSGCSVLLVICTQRRNWAATRVSEHGGVQADDGGARNGFEEGMSLELVHPTNITGSFKGEQRIVLCLQGSLRCADHGPMWGPADEKPAGRHVYTRRLGSRKDDL